MYGAFGKKSSHAPVRPKKRQFRPQPLRYFSQASSAKISGSQARNRFQTKKPRRRLPLQIIRVNTRPTLTAEANVNVSIGIAVSHLKASFSSFIKVRLSTLSGGALLNLRKKITLQRRGELFYWEGLGCPCADDLKESPQWVRKNFFSCGRNVSALPTMGRNAVVICTTTSIKITIHVFRPAAEWASE